MAFRQLVTFGRRVPCAIMLCRASRGDKLGLVEKKTILLVLEGQYSAQQCSDQHDSCDDSFAAAEQARCAGCASVPRSNL